MADTDTDAAPTPETSPAGVDDSLSSMNRSMRRLRIWLSALTAVLALLVLSACAPVVFVALILPNMEEQAPSAPALDQTRDIVESALGDRVSSLEVRPITVKDPTAPFPFAETHSVYVHAKLKGSGVEIAEVLSDGENVVESGLLPTRAPLTQRLTDDDYDRLLAAYRANTDKPLGKVVPYLPDSSESESGTVTLSGQEYRVRELWSARSGVLVTGTSIEDDPTVSDMRDALVFWRNPQSGEFAFLGVESEDDAFMGSSID